MIGRYSDPRGIGIGHMFHDTGMVQGLGLVDDNEALRIRPDP